MDKSILKEIGLTNYESDLYLTLLEHDQISAYELAEKTGMYRQATYDALNRLIEKGFVSSVKVDKAQLYRATNPNLILEYLNEKMENFKQMLPALNKLNKRSQDPLVVETYKGKNIIRIALRDIVNNLKDKKEDKELLCTAVDESIPFAKHKTTLEQYERDLLHYGIKERIIVKDGSKGLFKNGRSTYKKIPEEFFNENPIQIYGDNVHIIVWGNPDYLIIIRNKGVANAYRKQFELMWKVAKK